MSVQLAAHGSLLADTASHRSAGRGGGLFTTPFMGGSHEASVVLGDGGAANLGAAIDRTTSEDPS